MHVADDHPGNDGGDDHQQARGHDGLSLSSGEQSSATRDRGVRNRSGLGSIELFNLRGAPPQQPERPQRRPGLFGRDTPTPVLDAKLCRLPCRNRVTPPNLHGAFRATLVMPIIKGLLARPEGFEPPTPRFVVWSFALLICIAETSKALEPSRVGR